MDSTSETQILSKFDMIGATLSFICAIHCLLVPLAVVILPVIGGAAFLHVNPLYHTILVISMLAVAVLTMCSGLRIHHDLRVIAVLGVGALFLAASHFLTSNSDNEHMLLGLGGLCLVAGHILNMRLCKSCRSCS